MKSIKDALLKLGSDAWSMLHIFLTSKKVLTAALTAIASLLTEDPDKRKSIVELGLVLIVAMGATDWGRSAAIKKADASVESAQIKQDSSVNEKNSKTP